MLRTAGYLPHDRTRAPVAANVCRLGCVAPPGRRWGRQAEGVHAHDGSGAPDAVTKPILPHGWSGPYTLMILKGRGPAAQNVG